MSQRRSLVTGLSETPNVTEQEKKFVFGNNSKPSESDSLPEEPVSPSIEKKNLVSPEEVLPQYRGRVPLTTRCRPEIASALKRASLKRQLEGIEPCRIQEILEEAMEKWLKDHGYVN